MDWYRMKDNRIMRKEILKMVVCFLLLIHIQSVTAGLNGNGIKTYIEVNIDGDEDMDSLQLIVFDDDYIPVSTARYEAFKKYVATSRNGKFIFEFPLKGCKFFKVLPAIENLKGQAVLQRNLIEEGDRTTIYIKKNQVIFSGKGSHKMKIMESFKRENAYYRDSVMHSYEPVPFANKQIEYFYRYIKENEMLEQLWTEKLCLDSNLSITSGSYLKGEIFGSLRFACYLGANVLLKNNRFNLEEKDQILEIFREGKGIHNDVQNKQEFFSSDRFIQGELQRQLFKYQLSTWDSGENGSQSLDYLMGLSKKDTGWEKLITYYVFRAYHGLKDKDEQLKKMSMLFRSEYLKAEMAGILMMKEERKNFVLFDDTGTLISLSDFRGKPVFLDFWFIGCHACGEYFHKSVSKAEAEFADKVVFISVCIEKDKSKWIQAVKNGTYTSENVINLYTGPEAWKSEAVKSFGIVAAPSPFLLDKEGKIFTMDNVDLGLVKYEDLKNSIMKVLNN